MQPRTMIVSLSNALEALRSAKPSDTLRINRPSVQTSGPLLLEVVGTRSGMARQSHLDADSQAALCLLLRIDSQAGAPSAPVVSPDVQALLDDAEENRRAANGAHAIAAQRGAELLRVQSDLSTLREDAARSVMELGAHAATARLESARLAGELSEAQAEIAALRRTVERLRAGQSPARVVPRAPVVSDDGRKSVSLAALAAEVVADVEALAVLSAEVVAETEALVAPIVPATVRALVLGFPAGQQTRILGKAALTLDQIRGAFRFVFADRKDASKGGHWESRQDGDSVALSIGRALAAHGASFNG